VSPVFSSAVAIGLTVIPVSPTFRSSGRRRTAVLAALFAVVGNLPTRWVIYRIERLAALSTI
jgi:hypothetical protein